MKLYNEEQVRKALRHFFDSSKIWHEDEIIESLTPIELPSDEEIYARAEDIANTQDASHIAFLKSNKIYSTYANGAKWLRDKIQGGNNEQG